MTEKKTRPSKYRKVTKTDIEFIKLNYQIMTDAEIAKAINHKKESIVYHRKKLGLYKHKDKILNRKAQVAAGGEEVESAGVDPALLPLRNKGQKTITEIHKVNFLNSEKGERIKKLLNDEQFAFFVDEWASFSSQFEDLTHTEHNTIEHIIFLRIRILENQRELKKAMVEKNMLDKQNSILSANLDDEEATQFFQKKLAVDSHISDLNKEYRELLDKANTLYKSLAGTREQREKKGRITRETFFNLCEEFKKYKVREQEGRFAELLKKAMVKNKNALRNAIVFADGDIAPQLLDSDTVKEMEKQDK